ncbi:hypothetical protein [Marinicauda sp. Alg238-R41]|uniref:hypothetical protein n=1 Tax=Marinicauda sp. Alg238-R41 TaxID=2993447 RepID=UPI0022E49C5E|nr:hypothetical protein [Marinicauda sp. Alg238-R41]
MARKTQKARREPEHYVFAIEEPETTYSFSINQIDRMPGLFWEYPSLTFTGRCVFPERLVGETITARLIGSTERLDDSRHAPGWKPPGIGMLELSKRRGDFYAHVPMHSFWGMSATVTDRKNRFLLLYGPRLYRGQSMCTSMEITNRFDPEEL